MVDPTPLLKGFGAAADVAGQIATDKAINGRRKSPTDTRVDFTDGELLIDVYLEGGPEPVQHNLGRIANGAIVTKNSTMDVVYCYGTSDTDVSMEANGPMTVDIWVF